MPMQNVGRVGSVGSTGPKGSFGWPKRTVPHRPWCCSTDAQNQEYHTTNVHQLISRWGKGRVFSCQFGARRVQKHDLRGPRRASIAASLAFKMSNGFRLIVWSRPSSPFETITRTELPKMVSDLEQMFVRSGLCRRAGIPNHRIKQLTNDG